jgi:hypothetical protein
MILCVNEIQAGVIKEYSNTTGVPMQSCLDSAVDDWIRTVAAASNDPLPANVILFPDRLAN